MPTIYGSINDYDSDDDNDLYQKIDSCFFSALVCTAILIGCCFIAIMICIIVMASI